MIYDEKEMDASNRQTIENRIKLKFRFYAGGPAHGGVCRVRQYEAFKFDDGQEIDPQLWRECKHNKGYHEPNLKTKIGRELKEFLLNGLQKSDFRKPLNLLGISNCFDAWHIMLPKVHLAGDIIILSLDEVHVPADSNVIEITKKEYLSIVDAHNPLIKSKRESTS